MSTKRNYRRYAVKDISFESLKEIAILKGDVGTTVGLDVAKHEIVAVVRWPDGSYERPWSVGNPGEIGLLIERLCLLKETCGSLTIGLESTGTYSEAVRRAMTEAFLEIHRLSGKGVSDYKEIFDGVPSQHDGKDAAMIAELTCFGKGTPWPWLPVSEIDQTIHHQVARHNAFQNQANQWTGRLEGMLARHWPELTGLLKLRGVTLLKICTHYGSPSRLAADDDAKKQLRTWGRGVLAFSKIESVIESARTTAGLPIGAGEMAWLQEIASEVLAASKEVKACEKRMQQLAATHQGMKRYVSAVGAVTLCVIWSTVGDPKDYSSSGAFLKALGLNLKELSSGKRTGQLAITKRGPSLARKLLFYWALRAVQHPELKAWYIGFQKVGRGKARTSEHRKMKGLIAMMRKLCKSLWYAYDQDEAFSYSKVFPGQPLQEPRSRTRRRQRVGA